MPLFFHCIAAAVVVAFFICWAPFHAQRLLYVMFYRYEWKFVSEGTYQVSQLMGNTTGLYN